MKRLFSVAAVALLVVVGAAIGGRSVASAGASSGNKANADMLRHMEAEFMKSAAEHGSAGYMAYYADDAVELPNGADALQGKDAIAKTMGFLDQKDNHLEWTPVYADMAASGDLGYTYGTYVFTTKDKTGKTVEEHGKYTSIWKKQKDGKWKVVLDMGNANTPTK
jgi:ketosteroid isomerase-like protein